MAIVRMGFEYTKIAGPVYLPISTNRYIQV